MDTEQEIRAIAAAVVLGAGRDFRVERVVVPGSGLGPPRIAGEHALALAAVEDYIRFGARLPPQDPVSAPPYPVAVPDPQEPAQGPWEGLAAHPLIRLHPVA